jgi:hypothetical protein
MLRIYVPTAFGDVNLRPSPTDPRCTEVTTTKLTKAERTALVSLLTKYKVDHNPEKLEDTSFLIKHKFVAVHKHLVGQLKKGLEMVTALRIEDGTLVEVTNDRLTELEKEVAELRGEAQRANRAADDARREARAAQERRVVSVPVPTRGCPLPAITPREVRASRVLRTFLNPVQLSDFEQHGAFVVVGGDSGHRFRIAHRHSRILREDNHDTFVKDLDTGIGYCNELTDLPPSEESLALMVMIACRENWWLNRIDGVGR